MQTVIVVTAPEPEIDLDLVKTHLRVDGDDDDTLIEAFIAAAVSHIDGPHGWLRRAIWPQELEVRQDGFCGAIRLPYLPAISVVSIKYVDQDGGEQTVPPQDYVMLGRGAIGLAYQATWPTPRGDAECVRIRYEAGFETLPPAIFSAVLLMVGDLYKNRESTGADGVAVQMSTSVQALLGPYRSFAV